LLQKKYADLLHESAHQEQNLESKYVGEIEQLTKT